MGKTTLTVQEDTLERFNDLKATPKDEPEHSANHFLSVLMDAYENDTPPNAQIDVDALEELLLAANDTDTMVSVGELVEELERTRALVEDVPERTAEQLEARFR